MSEFKPGDKVTISHNLLKGRDWTIKEVGVSKEGYEYLMVENGIIRQLLGHTFGTRVMIAEDMIELVETRIAGLEWDKLENSLKGLTGGSNG